jgi:hypothetical protein
MEYEEEDIVDVSYSIYNISFHTKKKDSLIPEMNKK